MGSSAAGLASAEPTKTITYTEICDCTHAHVEGFTLESQRIS